MHNNPPHFKFLILGAGPTGLGAAWRLQELGCPDFLVLERNAYIGGLSASWRDEQGYTWDFAVHVAHSHYHYVDRLMETLLPDGFLTHERKSWIHTQQTFVPFPFQSNFRHLPEPARTACWQGLLHRPPFPADGSASFQDWILSAFGEGIAAAFMVPYNTKLWTVPPSAMSSKWLGDRVPEVDVERIRRNMQEERDDVSWGPNHVFHFPKTGGTSAIWESMADRIGRENIRLNSEVLHVDAAAKKITLQDGSNLTFDHLISTLPLSRLPDMLRNGPDISAAKKLQHSQVQVVCIGLPIPLPSGLQDKTWIYCPDYADAHYRITPFSLFSTSHTPDANNDCSFMCEVSTPMHTPFHPEAELGPRVLHDMQAAGLLPENLPPAHFHHLLADYAYPIPSLDRDAILGSVLPLLQQHGIYSRGRFGAWKYEVGNMDHSLMQGVECVDAILQGTPEVTYCHPAVVNAGKR